MKVRFESTNNTEGFRAGKPLDVPSIKTAVELMLFGDEEPEYHQEDDGSLILEIKDAKQETKDRVMGIIGSICSWDDMRYEELSE